MPVLMTFGEALNRCKKGAKISRLGWNGKSQYVELATRISYVNAQGETINADHEAIGSNALAFVGTSGVQIGWLASQADMLATDWVERCGLGLDATTKTAQDDAVPLADHIKKIDAKVSEPRENETPADAKGSFKPIEDVIDEITFNLMKLKITLLQWEMDHTKQESNDRCCDRCMP